VGETPVEPGLEEPARAFLSAAEAKGTRVLLPEDWLVEAPGSSEPVVASRDRVPAGGRALDIGPTTRARFSDALRAAKTVFWNGPLGRAEDPRFAEGTRSVLSGLRSVDGFRVAAGGDSARVAQELGVLNAFEFVSTGGGAALEFVQGLELPGLAAIPDA
jgi:phosphoglycerate kinase